jgi:hypothetical protein
LNKGKEQQLNHPDHNKNKEAAPTENQMVGMMTELPER